MIKLYKILFEQQESTVNYVAPTFGLLEWKDGSEHALALFHIDNFKKWIELDRNSPFEKWLCSYAATYNQHKNDCSGAVEVNFMVRSPEFAGAGSVMYALVSNFFQAPITSDRQGSTSNSAKKAWAKFESSSDWTKVDLDNYGDRESKWYRINGAWPNRSLSLANKPATPDESDDCQLPYAGTEEGINNKLGTANAWLYKGSINSGELISRANEALDEIANNLGKSRINLEDDIKIFSNKLFSKYYKGISG